MSSLSQCPKGHIFDRDLYPSCPYCDGLTRGRSSMEADMFTTPLRDYSGTREAAYSMDQYEDSGAIPTEPLLRTTAPEDDFTRPVHSAGTKNVVGWLAGIDGPYKGRSFELHKGYNRVGRKEGDIVLEKDETISRVNHFTIVYDEEDNRFLFLAGGSDNFSRVNGEKKYDGEKTELKAYSTIGAGKSMFMFVPLCTERFKWADD